MYGVCHTSNAQTNLEQSNQSISVTPKTFQDSLSAFFAEVEIHASSLQEINDRVCKVEQTIDSKDSSGGVVNILVWISILLNCIFAYFLFRIYRDFCKNDISGKKRMNLLANEIKNVENQLRQVVSRESYLNSQKVQPTRTVSSSIKRENVSRTAPVIDVPKPNKDIKPINETPQKKLVTKFCSFLVDENGDLKTEQRVLTDDDRTHLFKIEYEEESDTALYTINPLRKSAILADLQTFQNFTERFVINGTPTDIHVISPGKLHKSGRTWVVTHKLEVSFS